MCRWDHETFSLYQTYNHGQKSWDTFAFLGRFPIHTSPTPPLTPQTILHAFSFRIFSFQLCIGWGGENCKTIPKRMHCLKREPRNDRKIGILQYSPKDKLHVYKLFFTGNVSNAIRFWSQRLIACVQSPFRFLLKGGGLYTGKDWFQHFWKIPQEFPKNS